MTGDGANGREPTPLHVSETMFINRELSLIDFQERVLAEAAEERNPLLERVKFLAIVQSNLDEFFMVRVSGIHEQVHARVSERGPDGMAPGEELTAIRQRLIPLLFEQAALFH